MSKPKPILCPNPVCGHDIDRHVPSDYYCQDCMNELPVSAVCCDLKPSDIARALLTAEPTDDEVERAAEALWVASWTHSTWLDPTVDPSVWNALRTQARAALRAARGMDR